VETAINKYGNKDVRWSSQGMIRLSLEGMKRLFEPTVQRIKHAVHDVVNNVPGPVPVSVSVSVSMVANSHRPTQQNGRLSHAWRFELNRRQSAGV